MQPTGRSISFVDAVRWIVGPIFEKELCVASRRRRMFVLRSVYVLLIMDLVLAAWAATAVTSPSRAAYVSQLSRMAEAVAGTVIVLQFVVLPVFAAIMLSGAISEELRRRTLGVLMTTPITGFQIVFGKLAGSLIQLVLLMACALPVLALLRAFGGVPWEMVGPGLLVTFTTTVLAGSIALWFSIGSRRAPWVFLKTLVTMMLAFLVFPLVWQEWAGPAAARWIEWTNPYLMMQALVVQSSGKGVWLWHVLASLAVSGALVAGSVPRVRRAATRQLAGDPPAAARAWYGPVRGQPEPVECRIRHCPVLWYELRSYRVNVRSLLRPAAWGVGLLLVCQMAAWRAMAEASVQTGFIVCLSGLGLLVTAALAVFGITGERDSGTWTLLLATTLDERSIVEAKVTGALVRSLPAWLPLAFHVAVFTLAGYIHPLMILALAVILAGAAGLLLGTGVWCAVRFRRTSTAMMVNLGIVLVGWGLSSFGFACCCPAWIVSPLAQVGLLAMDLTGEHAWKARGSVFDFGGWVVMTIVVIVTALGYRWLSRRFRAWAAKRLRKTLAFQI